MNFGKNYIDLIRQLEQMPEHQRLERIRHSEISIEILQGNYRELIHHLEVHNNPKLSMKLMRQDKRELLHAYQIEITRFLHNYIAASLSLIDHTRVHYNELYGIENSFPDYQEQIEKRFKQHALSVFIKDLRQYIQHFRMPGLSSRISYTRDAPDFKVDLLIKTKDLYRFSGWKAKSKEYIAQFDSDIDLLKLIKDYQEHVNNFYDWFIKRQMEIHKVDVEVVQAHKKKFRNNEMMKLVSEIISKPKTMEEFEEELSRFYPDEELHSLKKASSKAERINQILTLIIDEEVFDTKAREAIKEIYKK